MAPADWERLSAPMRAIHTHAQRVLDYLEQRGRADAREMATALGLTGLVVVGAVLLLEQLELVAVEEDRDELGIVLRALPLEYGRIVDSTGAERWLCVARPVGASHDGERVVVPGRRRH